MVLLVVYTLRSVSSRLTLSSPFHSGYYDGATDLYEYGWGQSFHFSRFYKGESFVASVARHEHYLAAQMSLRPGMRVLDVGCGIGGPAREIARFADVNIVGVNNNAFQVGRARRKTKDAGLENQIQFVKGDFMKLSEQFGENSFDAGVSLGLFFRMIYGTDHVALHYTVYAIEATVHAPTWEGVYGEIFKVLKPGGVVSSALFWRAVKRQYAHLCLSLVSTSGV
jgi:sterol 24-C-methyltransferase